MDVDDDQPMEEIVVYNSNEEVSAIDSLIAKLENREAPPRRSPQQRRRRDSILEGSADSNASRLRQGPAKTPPPVADYSPGSLSPLYAHSIRDLANDDPPVLFSNDIKDFPIAFFDEEERAERYFPKRAANDLPLDESPTSPKLHWTQRRKQEKLEKKKKREATKKAKKAEDLLRDANMSDDGEMGSLRSERSKTSTRNRFSPTPTTPRRTQNVEERVEQETPAVENTQTVKKRRGRPPKREKDENERTEAPPASENTEAAVTGRKKIKRKRSKTFVPKRRTVASPALRMKSPVSGEVQTPGSEPVVKRSRLRGQGPSTSSQPDDSVSTPATAPKRGATLTNIQNSADTTPSVHRTRSLPSSRGKRSDRRGRIAILSAHRPATRSTDHTPTLPPVEAEANPEEAVVKAPVRYEPPVRITKEDAIKEIIDIYEGIPPQYIRMFHHHVKGFTKSLLEENPGLSSSANSNV